MVFGEQQACVQGWVRSGSLVHCITRWVSDTCIEKEFLDLYGRIRKYGFTATQQQRMKEKRGPERPLKDITPFWIKCFFISPSAFSPTERKFPLVTFFSCCHMTSSHSGKSSLVSLRPMIHHLNALHQLRSATTSSLLPSRESVSPADTPNKRRHSDRLRGFSAFGRC